MGGQVVEVKLGFKECFEQYNQNLNAQKVKKYFCCIICRSMVIWPSQEWPNWDWLRKIEWIADGSIAIVMHGITFYAKNTKYFYQLQQNLFSWVIIIINIFVWQISYPPANGASQGKYFLPKMWFQPKKLN